MLYVDCNRLGGFVAVTSFYQRVVASNNHELLLIRAQYGGVSLGMSGIVGWPTVQSRCAVSVAGACGTDQQCSFL